MSRGTSGQVRKSVRPRLFRRIIYNSELVSRLVTGGHMSRNLSSGEMETCQPALNNSHLAGDIKRSTPFGVNPVLEQNVIAHVWPSSVVANI